MAAAALEVWFRRPFVASDLASWLAVALALVALAGGYWLSHRPATFFMSGDHFIQELGAGRFAVGSRIVITTFGGSFLIQRVQALFTAGGIGIGFFRVGARRLAFTIEENPAGKLIHSGAIVNIIFNVELPIGHDRAWGRLRLKLSNGAKKRYKMRIKGLKNFVW